jgi:glucose/arabinose dehydrogenase
LHLHDGFVIHIFASGLGAARDLQFSPGGTLLVSNISGNSVYALPDKNNDGVADSVKTIITGENHVHGLAFYNGKLFIADVDKVVRYNWDENKLTATLDKVLFPLPENNDHNNRSLEFSGDGKLFISLGSTCNICRESSSIGGSVLVSDFEGTSPKVFATGLRNSPFFAINPQTKELWATEMGRDYLGDDTPPDEINIVREGKNYGWPNCYGDKIHDTNFDGRNPDTCRSTESPIFQIPAHSAPLGLTFINSSQFPQDWQNDLLVAYHGSWNRSVVIGYKIVHLKINANSITNSEDFLTGFLQGTTKDSSLGRPVDLAFDKNGSLYVSDDKTGNVYIIQKATN